MANLKTRELNGEMKVNSADEDDVFNTTDTPETGQKVMLKRQIKLHILYVVIANHSPVLKGHQCYFLYVTLRLHLGALYFYVTFNGILWNLVSHQLPLKSESFHIIT